MGELTKERVALFMAAAHCQGGHSGAGAAIAEVLGVGFPLNMPELVQKARSEGANPAVLWPWMTRTHGNPRRHPFFTDEELAEAERRRSALQEGER